MVAVFFVFRMRFYAAWCGAEASCISAGLGCYPEKSLSKPGGGPTVDYRYSKEVPSGRLAGRETSQTALANLCTLSVNVSPDPAASESYDFRTIQNIDCYNTDFCVKVRHGMRYWNMTVQWWLHHYIYPNSPFSSYTLR